MSVKIIGLGNKARNGKDTVAQFLKERLENCYIVHFADALKKEVSEQGDTPLIKRIEKNKFLIRDFDKEWYSEYLEEIFQEKNIEEYEYMRDKDPKILQFWGTQYRRFLNKNYWIDSVKKTIMEIQNLNSDKNLYFIIPDTRFINEKNFIAECNGIFCKVKRINPDGTQYVDPYRNSNHPSEIELDNVDSDYLIEARNLEELENKTLKFLDYLKIKFFPN